jgi:GTP pyrophosphokinase
MSNIENILWESLKVKIKDYAPNFNFSKLKEAFLLGKDAHKDQFRANGKPFFTHPLRVAHILTEYQADEELLISALLHDAIEDTKLLSSEIILEKFGENVLNLVLGVTKIEKEIDKKNEIYLEKKVKKIDIETIRKLLFFASNDIRTLLLKLADRLHNIRTLKEIKNYSKQEKKAKETFFIYVPLASRLCVWKMRDELERLTFPYIYPEDYEFIQKFLTDTENKKNILLNDLSKKIKNQDKKNIIKKIHHYSRGPLALKYIKQDKKNLTINDLNVLQIITDSEENCFLVLHLIHTLFKNRSKDFDWITSPRDNGYQAYLTEVVTEEGYVLQVRIMTPAMYERNWKGIFYDLLVKKDLSKNPAFLSIFENLNKITQDASYDFYKAAEKDILEDKIEVYTIGKTVLIPRVSNALDFFFFFQPERVVFLKEIYVNDRLVSFNHKIFNGDIIVGVYDNKKRVNFNWFYFVKTAQARIVLQSLIKKWDLEEKISVGKKILQKDFDWYLIGNLNLKIKPLKEIIINYFGINSLNDLYVLVAEGRIDSYDVVSKVFPYYFKDNKNKIFLKLKSIFSHSLYLPKEETMSFKIIGYKDKLQRISEIIKKIEDNNIIMNKLLLREDEKNKIFILTLRGISKKRKNFYHFLSEIEYNQEIIQILPLLSKRKKINFYFWEIFTVFFFFLILTKYPDQNLFLNIAFLLSLFAYSFLLFRFIFYYFAQLKNTIRIFLNFVVLKALLSLIFAFYNFYGFSYFLLFINFLAISLFFFKRKIRTK